MATDHDLLIKLKDRQDALERLINEVKELKGAGPLPIQTGTATITVNAGAVGIWVAVTCAAICTIATIGVFALFVNLDRKVDRATDYQQAIYRSAK